MHLVPLAMLAQAQALHSRIVTLTTAGHKSRHNAQGILKAHGTGPGRSTGFGDELCAFFHFSVFVLSIRRLVFTHAKSGPAMAFRLEVSYLPRTFTGLLKLEQEGVLVDDAFL